MAPWAERCFPRTAEGKSITVQLGISGGIGGTFLVQGSGSLSMHPEIECMYAEPFGSVLQSATRLSCGAMVTLTADPLARCHGSSVAELWLALHQPLRILPTAI